MGDSTLANEGAIDLNLRKSLFLIWALAFSSLYVSLIPINHAIGSPSWKKKANKVIAVAKENQHKKYKSGAEGPNEFDCSGFTKYVYKTAINLALPRSSREQAKVGTTVEKNNLRKGDLLFFNTNGNDISHVAIYMGDGKMIHAVNEDVNITIDHINDSYWKQTFVLAKRVIE